MKKREGWPSCWEPAARSSRSRDRGDARNKARRKEGFLSILLLSALVGTYLYNDQEVLNHIRAYFREVAPAFDPKIMGSLMDLIENRQIVGILGFAGLIWFSTWVFSSLRIALNLVLRTEKSQGILGGIGGDLLMILVVGGEFVYFLEKDRQRLTS